MLMKYVFSAVGYMLMKYIFIVVGYMLMKYIFSVVGYMLVKYVFSAVGYKLVFTILDWIHYNDAIMDTIASQITSPTIVYSTVYSDADQRKHQSSESLAFLCGAFTGDRTNGQ